MDFLEAEATLRRQTLYPTELRVHPWLLFSFYCACNTNSSSTSPRFLEHLEQRRCLDRETDAYALGFIETTVQLELHSGVEFGHCLGLVSHPKFTQTTFSELDSSPVAIVVNNYSQASAAVLGRAEREAGGILGEAGLRVLWLECPVGQSTADTQGPCQRTPVEYRHQTADTCYAHPEHVFQDSVFGFTVHPVLASVYYDYTVRRARSDDAEFEVPIILGCVIAHELGHLLLGSNDAGWEPKQVRQLMMGTLLFNQNSRSSCGELPVGLDWFYSSRVKIDVATASSWAVFL